MSRNVAASVRARLKQHADTRQEDFNLVLTRYGLERLLYRLSISPLASSYLLKGALLFSLWYDHVHRPTRDADLLGMGSDDVDASVAAFRTICSVALDDGIVFDTASIKGTEIRKDAGYGGVRIDIRAVLDGARITLQVDIGFGDAVTPAPDTIHYPVLLDDFPQPRLHAYPRHTVIAEKLHAICLLGMANTRLKDYFDLDVLMREGAWNGPEVMEAIAATFSRRKLPLPATTPIGLSDAFAHDAGKQAQWGAFLKKNRLDAEPFAIIVQRLRKAVEAVGVY
jgi:hypothetical protein